MASGVQRPTAVGVKRRACVNCTTGKAKCSPWSDSVCERCHRLEKDCVYLTVVHKRKSPRSNSRVQVLEKKVDGLVALLATKGSQAESQSGASPQSILGSKDTEVSCPSQAFQSPQSTDVSGQPTPLSSYSVLNHSDNDVFDIIERGWITVETAESLLEYFRSKAVHNFPFVLVPSTTTLNSLRRNTPFLFLSIMASMSVDNSPLQRQLGEEVRIQIHRRMLLGFKSSLELLQGLLVHLAWHYYFIFPHKQQMILLSQLCVTLVQQLELDKNPKKKKQQSELDDQEDNIHYLARIRALLGTYYLSSAFATSFRTRSTMPYSKYIEQCCHTLKQRKQFTTDELILHFVHNQELSRRIQDIFSYDDLENTEIRGENLTNITSKSLLRDLENLRNVVPLHLQDNIIINLEFLLLDYWIHEVAFHSIFWESPGTDRLSMPGSSSPSTTRIKMLFDSLQSCKAFLGKFISHPNSEMLYFTYPIFSKICYTLMSLVKLLHLKLEDGSGKDIRFSEAQPSISQLWNLGTAAREAGLPILARQVQAKFLANATNSIGADGEPDAMTIFAYLLGSVISGYEKEMKELQTPILVEKPAPSIVGSQDQIVMDLDTSFSFDANAPNTDGYGDPGPYYPGLDPNIQLNFFEDIVWERLLDDFVLP